MPAPHTFKAAVLPHAKGAKHSVRDRSFDTPLGSGEVIIKVTATAINPVDWKIRDWGFGLSPSQYPAVLGTDAAGEVVEAGHAVSPLLAVGDRVFFQGILGTSDASTFQQYCKMPAELVSKAPPAAVAADEQLAGVQLATVAGLVALYDEKTGFGLSPKPWELGGDRAGQGRAAVVLGGSSSVGQYAIQLARLSGFDRIVANASAKHAELLKSLGAHVALDRATSGAREFKEALGGLPLAFVFDSISTQATNDLGREIKKLAGAGGEMALVAVETGEEKESGDFREVLGAGSFPSLRHISEPFVKAIGGQDGWIATGRFTPNKPVVVPGGLAAVDAALDRNKAGMSGEKVVIRPFDP